MTFNEYQEIARKTAVYPSLNSNLVYPAMGLVGEAGELCDKIKKLWRNQGFFPQAATYTSEELIKLRDELGDVLWYVSALASEMGYTLEMIAKHNIEKLQDRANRNVIKSEGDNR